MSAHATRHIAGQSTPSLTTSSTPTTSSDHLVLHSPPPAYMPEKVAGPSDSGTSFTRRTAALPHTSGNNTNVIDSPPDSSYTPPSGLRSTASRPASIRHEPSISPSALEAGRAKDMASSESRYSEQVECGESEKPDGVWPPWKRDGGWAEWRNEWVKKEALVVPLVVQALSAGVLDATTYADFMTFASNREASNRPTSISIAGWIRTDVLCRDREYYLALRQRRRNDRGHHQIDCYLPWRLPLRCVHLWSSRSLLWYVATSISVQSTPPVLLIPM